MADIESTLVLAGDNGDSEKSTVTINSSEKLKEVQLTTAENEKTGNLVGESPRQDSVSDDSKGKNDGFISPLSLPPVAKPPKKQDVGAKSSSSVSMTFRSKFAIPADIYKAPRAAAFMAEMPVQSKNEHVQKEESKVQDVEADPKKSKIKQKPPTAKFSYDVPAWTTVPEDQVYSLEVLKTGSIIDKVDLCGKEYFIVGRLPDCDIKMEHPSISRYHAVLQYGAPGPNCENVELQKDGSRGFYVYDLGSTHGTIINKQTVGPKIFYRIKVGHVIKFGGSTRLFILQGPSEDQEEEAKETATELREFNKQKIKKKKDLEKMMLGEDSSSDEDDADEKKKKQRNVENLGVTWGMLEDAVEGSSDDEEEEEPGDLKTDHPDAIAVHVKKDPFYVKDPVKALKNLYEREKMELDFECSERRSGHWHVRLCLPIDSPSGKPVYSEVNATGKKKDTIRQCALEACRVLERHGMFHHKDHHKQKVKQWQEDDFYDSDEDEFNDRTGELEMKRNNRMRRAGKASKGAKVIETYESLVKKVTDLDTEIRDIETKLQKDKEVMKVSSASVDPLDAFMQQVKSGKALDTTTRAKLKRRLFEAKKEHMRVSKLADLARPSSLPPLANSFSKTYSFIGKMKGKPKPVANVRPVADPLVLENDSADKNEEEEEEDEETGKPKLQPGPTKVVKLMDVTPSKKEHLSNSDKNRNKNIDSEPKTRTEYTTENGTPSETDMLNTVTDSKLQTSSSRSVEIGENSQSESRKRVLGPALPPEVKDQLLEEEETPAGQDNIEEETSEPKRKRRRPRKPRQTDSAVQYSNDPKYSVWLPPEDQSGDGKIGLNEKLGY